MLSFLSRGFGKIPGLKKIWRRELDLPFPVSKRDPDPVDQPEDAQPAAMTSSNSHSTTPKEGQVETETPARPATDVDLEAQHTPPCSQQPERKSATRLARLPTWISFWLGYRKVQPPPEKNYVVWIWSFIGTFTCISSIQALFGNTTFFVNKGVPSIGATAVLLYGAIESPLSQPRPVVGGHLVGALTGIAVTKLFLLLPTEQRFEDLEWLAGSLSCSFALVFMQMTGTMHPPAGATALLAAISPEIRDLGWLYLPVVLLACTIALTVALFSNNMQRRYPTYWWTPPPTTAPSFFAVLPLGRTLTKTWTWTSTKSKNLTAFSRFSAGRKRSKKGFSSRTGSGIQTPNILSPREDKDWHYSIKNYSKVFGSAAGNGPASRGRSRETSKTRHSAAPGGGDKHRRVSSLNSMSQQRQPPPPLGIAKANTHCVNSPMTSTFPSPHASLPATPISLSPSASASTSRRPSAEDLHVAFRVQPLHHHLHHSSRHAYHQHTGQNVNYLRYLAMKREGTWSPSGMGSGHVSPGTSAVLSRRMSSDRLNHQQGREASAGRDGPSVGLSAAEPDPEHDPEEHAQQLIKAVNSVVREREAQEKIRARQDSGSQDDKWEDVDDHDDEGGSPDGQLEVVGQTGRSSRLEVN